MSEVLPVVSSAGLAETIESADFSSCSATIVGFGNMGRQYLKSLQGLGVRRIRVCSLSPDPLKELASLPDVERVAGGVQKLQCYPASDELGVVATPPAMLVAATERLAALGFRRLLVEKPVSLWSAEIGRLAASLEQQGVDTVCGYNRVAYPSFHEVRSRVSSEGGITSCSYTFTEIIKKNWPQRFEPETLARWGIANSMHVLAMAHGLIGLPKSWSSYRSGSFPWHPSGAVFTGSGISDQGIPFSCHADWGSTGRWSVEVYTRVASYRMCPLERVFRRASSFDERQEVSVTTFAPQLKAGILEQVAAMLSSDIRRLIPLLSLKKAAALTAYGEDLLGYSRS
jgi:predicted dehydrogenase